MKKGIKMELKWENDVQKGIGWMLQKCQFEHPPGTFKQWDHAKGGVVVR
jgi:hypothetical protein